jgi:hypothetical protein
LSHCRLCQSTVLYLGPSGLNSYERFIHSILLLSSYRNLLIYNNSNWSWYSSAVFTVSSIVSGRSHQIKAGASLGSFPKWDKTEITPSALQMILLHPSSLFYHIVSYDWLRLFERRSKNLASSMADFSSHAMKKDR